MSTPHLSLTDFVDFVSVPGLAKANKLAQVKNRPIYQPAFDFWKPLRDHIVETHKSGGSRSDLKRLLHSLLDPKKISSYPDAVQGYYKWWGRKSLSWFEPPRQIFSSGIVEVSVNPELGLEVNGVAYVIKLYFKSEVLAKRRTDIILHLMKHTLSPVSRSPLMGVLDVQRSRLFTAGAGPRHLHAALLAEMAYIASIWPQV